MVAARLAPGRGGGGGRRRRGHRPARPALWPRGGSGGNKTFPAWGLGRGGEGRGGEQPSERASGTPSWAGPLPLPPGAGEPIRPPRPLLLQDPMTQRPEQGGGGLGWLLPYRPSPLVIQASTSLSATCPSSAAPPLHNSLPGKGNRNQEEGVSEGRGSPSPPYTAKTPRGMGAGQGFGPKPPSPLETRIAEEGPHKSNTLLLLLPRSSWGQAPHLCNRAVNIYMIYGSLLGSSPRSGEPLPQNLLIWGLE